MIKFLTVLGARPQFIKASVVSAALSRIDGVNEVLVHTGQHHDANMSDVFFSELAIPSPQHHLGIHGGLHEAMTGKCWRLSSRFCYNAVLLYRTPIQHSPTPWLR